MAPRWPAAAGALALALALGTAGGAAFVWVRLPLAWMLGAMCVVTVAAVGGAPVRVPPALRLLMIAVLGVMLGSAFRPAMFARAGEWVASLSGLLVFVVAASALAAAYFRRVAGYDRITAYFSAIPGGLSEMILVGGAAGGDDRTIALTHASRVLLVVLAIPLWFRVVAGYQPPAGGGVGAAFPPLATMAAGELAILAACGIGGFALARLGRLPSPALVGPLAASALVHLTGLSQSRPPAELVMVAQIVIGTAIGCRFAGAEAGRVIRAMAVAAGATALMVATGAAFAFALAAVSDLPASALFLAYAPGGLAEMSLIALALGVDPALVSSHHVVRIVIVVVVAPLVFELVRARRR